MLEWPEHGIVNIFSVHLVFTFVKLIFDKIDFIEINLIRIDLRESDFKGTFV